MAKEIKLCSQCKKYKPYSCFHKSKKGKYGLQSECKKCKHKWRVAHYNKNRPRLNRLRQKRGYHNKKQLINYKGGKCQICGYNDCIASLDFHHKSKKEKELDIGRNSGSSSLKRLKKEVDKCILVCSNCHRKIHYNEKKVKWEMN